MYSGLYPSNGTTVMNRSTVVGPIEQGARNKGKDKDKDKDRDRERERERDKRNKCTVY